MRGVYLASVCLHVLAAMTWVGGMVIFVAAVMPYFRNQDDKAREDVEADRCEIDAAHVSERMNRRAGRV